MSIISLGKKKRSARVRGASRFKDATGERRVADQAGEDHSADDGRREAQRVV